MDINVVCIYGIKGRMRRIIFITIILALFGCASQQKSEPKKSEPASYSFSIPVNTNLSIDMIYRHLLVYGGGTIENLTLSKDGIISGRRNSNFTISKVNNALLFEFSLPVTPREKEYFTEITKMAEERIRRQIEDDKKLFKIDVSSKDDIKGRINIQRMTIYITDSFDVILRKEEIPNTSTEYTMIYSYNGSNYPYIENIQVKIDDTIFTCNISNQSRGRLLGIIDMEISSIILTYEMVAKLKKCTSLTVQANGKSRGSPITIHTRGIPNINSFFQ
jgi:hypothetical protein